MNMTRYEVTLGYCGVWTPGWIYPLDSKKEGTTSLENSQASCSLEKPRPGSCAYPRIGEPKPFMTEWRAVSLLCPTNEAVPPPIDSSQIPLSSTFCLHRGPCLTHLPRLQGLPLLSLPQFKLIHSPWTSATASRLMSPLQACLDPLRFCSGRQSEPLS